MLYSVLATATPLHSYTHTNTHTRRLSPLSQAINDNARVQFQFSKLVFSAKVATSSLRADKRQGISRTPFHHYLSTHMWRVCVCVCVCVCGRYCGSQTACQAVAVSVTHSFVHCTLSVQRKRSQWQGRLAYTLYVGRLSLGLDVSLVYCTKSTLQL